MQNHEAEAAYEVCTSVDAAHTTVHEVPVHMLTHNMSIIYVSSCGGCLVQGHGPSFTERVKEAIGLKGAEHVPEVIYPVPSIPTHLFGICRLATTLHKQRQGTPQLRSWVMVSLVHAVSFGMMCSISAALLHCVQKHKS